MIVKYIVRRSTQIWCNTCLKVVYIIGNSQNHRIGRVTTRSSSLTSSYSRKSCISVPTVCLTVLPLNSTLCCWNTSSDSTGWLQVEPSDFSPKHTFLGKGLHKAFEHKGTYFGVDLCRNWTVKNWQLYFKTDYVQCNVSTFPVIRNTVG